MEGLTRSCPVCGCVEFIPADTAAFRGGNPLPFECPNFCDDDDQERDDLDGGDPPDA